MNPASWLSLALGASSHNLGPIFYPIPVKAISLSNGTMQTSLMPVSSPPADSHVLRTRASPSATTSAMDYDLMPPPPPPGMGGGRDDSKIVCKFAPVSRTQNAIYDLA